MGGSVEGGLGGDVVAREGFKTGDAQPENCYISQETLY